MERITVFMENIMIRNRNEFIIGLIAAIAPLYFLKTLYVVTFGPMEVFHGFHSERYTWLIFGLVDFVGFLATLPSREKGRVMQVVMGLWTIEMMMIFMVTMIR